MIRKTITLINKLGLHARAAMKLINTASRYQSSVLVGFNKREVDAKDIICVMVLGAACGSDIDLIADGPDEQEAITALEELINNRFGEEA